MQTTQQFPPAAYALSRVLNQYIEPFYLISDICIMSPEKRYEFNLERDHFDLKNSLLPWSQLDQEDKDIFLAEIKPHIDAISIYWSKYWYCQSHFVLRNIITTIVLQNEELSQQVLEHIQATTLKDLEQIQPFLHIRKMNDPKVKPLQEVTNYDGLPYR